MHSTVETRRQVSRIVDSSVRFELEIINFLCLLSLLAGAVVGGGLLRGCHIDMYPIEYIYRM